MVETKNKSDVITVNKGFQLVLLLLFFAGFIYDVFFIVPAFALVSDMRLFSLLLLWIFLSKISNFNGTATFKITLIFTCILSVLFIFYRDNPSIERLASWVYIYLATGVIQQLLEARSSKKM